MSNLTQRERKLFIGFCAVFALVVGGWLAAAGVRSAISIYRDNARLAERIETLSEDLKAKPEWERRDAWLDGQAQIFDSREIASSHLLDLVNESAEEFSLELLERELVEVSDEPEDGEGNYFDSSSVRIVVSEKEEKIFRWIHNLQSPEDLLGVTALKIESGDLLKVEVEVTMWYFEAE